jgi:hypothetical protein
MAEGTGAESAPEGRDLDAVLDELAQATEDLLATPDTDVERRLELRARRERLRAEANEFLERPDGPE